LQRDHHFSYILATCLLDVSSDAGGGAIGYIGGKTFRIWRCFERCGKAMISKISRNGF